MDKAVAVRDRLHMLCHQTYCDINFGDNDVANNLTVNSTDEDFISTGTLKQIYAHTLPLGERAREAKVHQSLSQGHGEQHL